jgi:RNA polymerase sigma-70 factor (ECF subfamily)
MEDEEAIGRCLQGDAHAFRALVERYQSRALGHATAILRNRDDAQDAVQDAFIDAYRALHTFHLERGFYPWFYAVLRHCCARVARRRPAQTVDADAVDVIASNELPADERLVIEHALAALSVADREILTLRHLDGLSYAELAEFLEIPIGTVMSRLYNSRLRFRAAFAPSDAAGRRQER